MKTHFAPYFAYLFSNYKHIFCSLCVQSSLLNLVITSG
ncbi:hypothetical protein D0812_23690 [Vibrio owensii]|uniref:Uncharacterized protein n=2 Tax=Vibrio harveyi group TaxID=717610 RepID=A0AAP9GG81_9VIBR|nr:hypothetical protein D0812_23690 [Vibrio owensii]NOH49142.1 hypothetical protein [Vibrio rotiferianus]QGH49515.1 hypothetical protein APZ19_20685 [Vibrio owensii]